MELDEAYRILEVEPGSGEEAVREARKLLAKVWHPDRHASDPKLMARAQAKLADINAAFEVVSAAGFPAKQAAAKPTAKSPITTPPPPEPSPYAEPGTRGKYDPHAKAPPKPADPAIEFVPRRRVRWPVILVLAAALGIGAYFAITKLGSTEGPRDPVAVADAAAKPSVDAAIVNVADAAAVDAAPSRDVVRREKTFTLGSTEDEVIEAQGRPNGRSRSITIVNGVRSGSATLTYDGTSKVQFDADDKVVGWSEGDVALHVRLDVRDAALAATAKARGTFAIGASTDEVLGILGPPPTLAGNTWSYGTSTIEVEGGKVVNVTQGVPKLPITP